ncbi:MAG: response regulator transcription factor [Ignavibacteriae bacterium]|nr:response regulator transcription factor [Ignavibacteriota bacterium]
MKLLIVDDNTSMRDFIKITFEDTFTETFECNDGFYSFEIYKKNKPDWVFMDIKMEKVDGIEATENIISKFPLAKIIILTDYDNNKLKQKALKAGATAYVVKEDLMSIFNLLNIKPEHK